MKSKVGKFNANTVTITDSGDIYTATDVEGALAEVKTQVDSINPSDTFDCDSGVAVNDLVYLDGSSILQKSSNNDSNTLPLFGIVSAKPTSTTCQIITTGDRGSFSGLTAGAIYYLGVNGGVTSTAPTSANTHVVPIGVAKNSSSIMVLINNRGIINT